MDYEAQSNEELGHRGDIEDNVLAFIFYSLSAVSGLNFLVFCFI